MDIYLSAYLLYAFLSHMYVKGVENQISVNPEYILESYIPYFHSIYSFGYFMRIRWNQSIPCFNQEAFDDTLINVIASGADR